MTQRPPWAEPAPSGDGEIAKPAYPNLRSKLFSIRQITEMEDVAKPCRATVNNWIRDGKLRALKLGSMTRVVGDSLADMLETAPVARSHRKLQREPGR
jgi:hypothetical protein